MIHVTTEYVQYMKLVAAAAGVGTMVRMDLRQQAAVQDSNVDLTPGPAGT